MNDFERFFALHHRDRPFIIANVWNVKSARIAEKCGFDAIATSSGAIADSLGYEDGEKIPFSELLYIIERIKSCTTVPLSVDLERGYSDHISEVNDHIQKLIDIGVVGFNLEDAQGEDIYLEKLNSIKNYLERKNAKLFLNARTDAFLKKLDSPLEVTIRRAKLYQDAGADGLFVTAVPDAAAIKEITSSTTLPVNVVATPRFPSVDILADCGVRRISMAVLLYRATYTNMESIAGRIKTENSFAHLF